MIKESPKILSPEELKEKEATEKLKANSEAKQREEDLKLLAERMGKSVSEEEFENWRKRQPDRTD